MELLISSYALWQNGSMLATCGDNIIGMSDDVINLLILINIWYWNGTDVQYLQCSQVKSMYEVQVQTYI